MKKVIYILPIFILSYFSCNQDVLERGPLDIISDNVLWEDPVLIDAFILDLYSRMVFLYNDHGYTPSGRNDRYTINIVSDQATNGRNHIPPVVKFQAGLMTESGGWDNWHYGNIRTANEIIEKLESSSLSEEVINGFMGRAKFARALFYFITVKWYGGMPIIEKPQEISASNEELLVPRSQEYELYDFIISECDDIINNALLPESPSRKGDPSVYVAHALKSRAALYAASIARWGEVKNNGLNGIPKEQEQKYWQICYDASKVLMDGPFALYNKIPNDPVENYRMLSIDEDNSEVIWAKYYDGVEVVNDWSVENAVIGWSASWLTENICPYLEFVEDFENKNGEIIPWNREEVASRLWTYDELFGDYEARFHAMIFTNGSNWCGFNSVEYYNGIRTSEGEIIRDGIYNGISAMGQNYRTSGRDFSGFGIKKGVDPTGSQTTYTGKNQRIQFRLGEIILNFAEAAYYLNKPEESLQAVNMIRDRVKLPLFESIDEERIRHERKIELAFEAHRHWDLKRWRIATEKITKSDWTGVNYILDYDTGKFMVEYKNNFRNSRFDEKHYYFPITPGRIANNPALAPENPGY